MLVLLSPFPEIRPTGGTGVGGAYTQGAGLRRLPPASNSIVINEEAAATGKLAASGF